MVPRRFAVRILVTAGNTQAPIDRVRCLTNIFTGRTGGRIALHAHDRGHEVTLLTSHPETVEGNLQNKLPHKEVFPPKGWSLQVYRTFDELQSLMSVIRSGPFDAVVHSAAVSDYLAAGVYSPAAHTYFQPDGRWTTETATPPRLEDRAADKVKSDYPELWIRLLRAPKLIERIRADWGFRGVLVKFKLEVGISDSDLLEIAERSRRHSEADLMVANTLEGMDSWAYLGPLHGRYERVERSSLPKRLLDEIERLHEERHRG
jgi:phosphopantothenoylcysteine synthetase/decarboxylase